MTAEQRIYKENITLDLPATSKEEVIEKLANILYQNKFVSDVTLFINDVMTREKQMTTGIGNQLAIPHGKSQAVIESTVAVAHLAHPIDWNALDEQPVHVVFLLAIKQQDQGDTHLRLLADLSGKLMDDEFVRQVKQASTVERLYEALTVIENN